MPSATRLRRWLAREVLPQIRATGSYNAAPQVEAGPVVDEDAVRARVLVELHADGVLDDRGLVGRLDDEQLTALPGAVLGPLVRRLAGGPAAKSPSAPKPPSRSPTLAPPPEVPPLSGWTTERILAHVLAWAREHAARIVTDFGARTPSGGWLGRWLQNGSRLAVPVEVFDGIILGTGLSPSQCRTQLRDSKAIDVTPCASSRHNTQRITLSRGVAQRCIVLRVQRG